MTKNLIIAILLILLGVLASICIDLTDTIEKAKSYINDLEEDFPEYIDITAERDSYTEYYDV
jgi:hypothetical protein